MRPSSEDCSSSSSDAPPKELFGNGDGESENLLASLNHFASMRERKGKQWLKSVKAILVPLNIVFLVANALGWLVMATRQPASFTTPQIASPSPAEEVIQHELHRFTGVGPGESPWNMPPGEETDKAWDGLIDNGKWFAIDRDMFVEINGNPDTGLRIPGDPKGRFFGMLQVNHQLHCVDILRRSTWFNIDHYRQKGQFANMSDPDLVLHTRHCLEILRQTIQCHGDTAMLTYNWVHGHDWPQSAWRSLHSCQNWDMLNEWRTSHDISHLVTHLERPSWVLDRNAVAPGRKGAAEAVQPIVCRDLECGP